MSAGIAAAPQFAAGDIDGLARAICRRVAWELSRKHADHPDTYPPLKTRIFLAREGRSVDGRRVRPEERTALLVELEVDLRELLTVSTERLRQVVFMEATSARCDPNEAWPAMPQSAAIGLPRIQAGEIISRLASRGVMIAAENGKLHVRPPELLNDADRRMLVDNKATIIAALSQPGAVF